MTLGSLLDTKGVSAGEVTSHISSLSVPLRGRECLTRKAAQQRRLWQLASPTAGATSGELLSGTISQFAGRNSLRLFSRFEKWFARSDGSIVGCNRHALSPLIGPGYFTVRDDLSGQLELDYGHLPAQAPAGWPAIRANTDPLARPVYENLVDKVVWISPDVLIGAAFRGATPLDSYFVLVRKTQ